MAVMKYRYIVISGLAGSLGGVAVMLLTRPLIGGVVIPIILGGLTAILVPLIFTLIAWEKMK